MLMFRSARIQDDEPPKKVDFYADHPFVIGILYYTDSVMFMGRILNPQ
jgi:hypothetical protein